MYQTEKPVYFQSHWLVDKNINRHEVNRHIRKLKAEGLINYVVLGGGRDEDGDPFPPWHGYRVTERYLEELEVLG